MKKRILMTLIVVICLITIFIYLRESNLSKYDYLKNPTISDLPTKNMLVVEGQDNPKFTAEKAVKFLFSIYKSLKYVPKLNKGITPRVRFYIYPKSQTPYFGQYALPLPTDISVLPLLFKNPDHFKISIAKWKYGTCTEILHKGSYYTIGVSKRKLEDFINRNNYRVVDFYEEEYVRRPGLFGLFKPVTILRYKVIKDEPVILKGKAPISTDFAYTELASLRGNRRFNVTITFKLNKADSLYKQGEHFLLYFIDNKVEGDTTEFINWKYAIIDDKNKQATFSIHLNKGNIGAHHSFTFGGGRLIDKQDFYKRFGTLLNGKYYLLSDNQPLKFGDHDFYIDYSAGYFIQKRFLQDWELNQYK
jgi:hypothetical protein